VGILLDTKECTHCHCISILPTWSNLAQVFPSSAERGIPVGIVVAPCVVIRSRRKTWPVDTSIEVSRTSTTNVIIVGEQNTSELSWSLCNPTLYDQYVFERYAKRWRGKGYSAHTKPDESLFASMAPSRPVECSHRITWYPWVPRIGWMTCWMWSLSAPRYIAPRTTKRVQYCAARQIPRLINTFGCSILPMPMTLFSLGSKYADSLTTDEPPIGHSCSTEKNGKIVGVAMPERIREHKKNHVATHHGALWGREHPDLWLNSG